MKNIKNIAVDSYAADGKERYVCEVDLKIDGAEETVIYGVDPYDTVKTGRRIWEEIQKIKVENPEAIKPYEVYKKELQTEEYLRHNERAEAERKARFKEEADPLYMKWQETGEESDKLNWTDKKNQIRAEIPYLEEMTQKQVDAKYPLLKT